MRALIAILPGDGIGPEVTAQAAACLALLSDHFDLGLTFETHDFGGAAPQHYLLRRDAVERGDPDP